MEEGVVESDGKEVSIPREAKSAGLAEADHQRADVSIRPAAVMRDWTHRVALARGCLESQLTRWP